MHFTEYLSRRRGELLGISALVVVIAHSYAELPIRGWHYFITLNCPMVIDFFLILAAMGGVYSLERNPDATGFIMRRLKRILPAYYVGVALYTLVGGIDSLPMLCAHIVPICTWTDKYWSTYWYISAAIVYYLLIPLIYRALKNARRPRLTWAVLFFLSVVPLGLCSQDTEATIALMRIHSVITGTALGLFHFTHTEKKDRWIDFGIIVALYILGFAMMVFRTPLQKMPWIPWDTHQYGYLMKGFRGPLVGVAYTFALDLGERVPVGFINAVMRRVNAALRWIGSMSLELYMVHIPLRHVLYYNVGLRDWQLLLAMLIPAIPLAWGLSWLCKHIPLPGDRKPAKA